MSLVIDTDTHYWEPVSLWSEYIDPQFKDRAPHLVEADGRLLVQVGEHLYPSNPHHPGIRRTYGAPETIFAPQRQANETALDPAARLRFMDETQTDVHVIFPTLAMAGFSGIGDPALAGGCARAYNRFCADFASTDPKRLRPVMLVPFNHPDVARQEMEFAREELGLRIAFANPTPPNDIYWSHERYDDLWSTMEDLGVVLAFHESALGAGPTSVGLNRYGGQGHGLMYLCAHTVEPQLAIMDMLLGGAIDRHRRLRVGLFEAHLSWLAGWLQLLDHMGDRYEDSRLESGARPSDLFREQFFISAFPDDVGIGKVAEEVGVKNVVYSSDWPHKSMEAAKTQHCTLDDFRLRSDLDDDEKEAISGINAVEWFSL
jgi:predicted TIM-barrel fold metal-dependent hydrolase